jgi:hypothetical protein
VGSSLKHWTKHSRSEDICSIGVLPVLQVWDRLQQRGRERKAAGRQSPVDRDNTRLSQVCNIFDSDKPGGLAINALAVVYDPDVWIAKTHFLNKPSRTFILDSSPPLPTSGSVAGAPVSSTKGWAAGVWHRGIGSEGDERVGRSITTVAVAQRTTVHHSGGGVVVDEYRGV